MIPSENVINVRDLSSFLAPVRYLDSDVGTNPGDVRWDLVPGDGGLGFDINALDLNSLLTSFPPMVDRARAFDGPSCPWP